MLPARERPAQLYTKDEDEEEEEERKKDRKKEGNLQETTGVKIQRSSTRKSKDSILILLLFLLRK